MTKSINDGNPRSSDKVPESYKIISSAIQGLIKRYKILIRGLGIIVRFLNFHLKDKNIILNCNSILALLHYTLTLLKCNLLLHLV